MFLVDKPEDAELHYGKIKTIYNVDNSKTASEWAKEDIKKLKTFDCPNVSSALNIKNDDKTRGRIFENALGYFYNAGNNINKNAQSVGLFSSAFGNGHGHGISKDNFTKCTMLFACRRLIDGNWVNWADEYIAPNKMHPNYRKFELDSAIYSLFESKSNQSSLRNIEYKGKRYDIKNEFFFMGKDEILELADKNGNRECYADCCGDKERFVYEFIKNHYDELSEDAKTVLEKAKDLVRKSFQYRGLFNDLHPEYQINNWDCRWYQIKGLCKEFMPNELKEFTELYKEFGNKLRPMVYELGFLKQ